MLSPSGSLPKASFFAGVWFGLKSSMPAVAIIFLVNPLSDIAIFPLLVLYRLVEQTLDLCGTLTALHETLIQNRRSSVH